MKVYYVSGSIIGVTAGEVVVSNEAGTLRLMLSTPSATELTFADLDTGSEDNNTYYIYAIAATAAAETATFKISLNATAPDGVTYYKRLGGFVNVDGDMEQAGNDNENMVVSTGTVANGETVSVPSNFSADECKWTVSSNNMKMYDSSGSGGCEATLTATSSITDARVFTGSTSGSCRSYSNTFSGNYIVVCHR